MTIKPIDKSTWPKGPWTNEPDEWEDICHGLRCRISRNAFGAFCGYVEVERKSALHGVHYSDDLPDGDRLDQKLSVHGGVTWSGPHPDDAKANNTSWWIGFNCSHISDYSPLGPSHQHDPAYCDLEYVMAETISLALQLSSMLKPARVSERVATEIDRWGDRVDVSSDATGPQTIITIEAPPGIIPKLTMKGTSVFTIYDLDYKSSLSVLFYKTRRLYHWLSPPSTDAAVAVIFDLEREHELAHIKDIPWNRKSS